MLLPYSLNDSIDLDELEKYILEYIGKNKNIGNVLAISGMWGGGKTYFWKNRIEPKLKSEDDIDKYVYISLYGIDSVAKLEQILSLRVQKLLDETEEKLTNKIGKKATKRLKVFTEYGLKAVGDVTKKYFGVDTEEYKNAALRERAKEILRSQNIIVCFDDLERKSSKLLLNDFFGYINSLSEIYQLTIVIIYNEKYLKEEKKVYDSTKEKLISKYIAFNPKIEKLFSLILEKYKDAEEENYYFVESKLQQIIVVDILEVLHLINARTYEKILNNIFEWLSKYPDQKSIEIMKSIALSTISFTHYNTTLEFKRNKSISKEGDLPIRIERYFLFLEKNCIKHTIVDFHDICIKSQKDNIPPEQFIDSFMAKCESQSTEKYKKSLQAIYLFGYCLAYGEYIDIEVNNKISKFIKTGIL